MSLLTSIVPSYHEEVGLLMQMVKLGPVVLTKRRQMAAMARKQRYERDANLPLNLWDFRTG
jgi:hypothetical protein